MKKIGVLFGMENTFPGALVDKINAMEIAGIQAEFVHVGGVSMAEPSGYAVIVDRISHDIPFYRSFLKNAVLTGTQVINNPFWWSADDKFFNYALATKLGVAIPNTVLLPHKNSRRRSTSAPCAISSSRSTGTASSNTSAFPPSSNPTTAAAGATSTTSTTRDEFFHAYDQTRDLCMTLQTAVNFKEYFRCYVVGQDEVHIMPYDPRRPHEQRYVLDPPEYDPKLLKRVEKDALTLCRALGYDLNTVEFAVEDGIPYAIDFMNPAPDADLHSVGQENFDWIVNAVADLAVKKAQNPTQPELRWAALLGSEKKSVPLKTAAKKAATKSPAKKAAKKITE